jgi:hypothetical protein
VQGSCEAPNMRGMAVHAGGAACSCLFQKPAMEGRGDITF